MPLDLSQMDGATLQTLLDAVKKKKEPTMMDRAGAGVSAIGQGVQNIGQPGQFYRRGPNGELVPQGGESGGGGAGAAPSAGGGDSEAMKKRAKAMKGLLAKIFKSKMSPVDIRPDKWGPADDAEPEQYASNNPFRMGGIY